MVCLTSAVAFGLSGGQVVGPTHLWWVVAYGIAKSSVMCGRGVCFLTCFGCPMVQQAKRLKLGHPQAGSGVGGTGGSVTSTPTQQQQQVYSQVPTYNIAQERLPADLPHVQQQFVPNEGDIEQQGNLSSVVVEIIKCT